MNEVEDRAIADAPTGPGKVDPESLALRVQPAQAIRFKRSAVVAIAELGSVSLVATAWVSLLPSPRQLAGQADDQMTIATPPGDALNALPGSYGDVPSSDRRCPAILVDLSWSISAQWPPNR